MNEPTERTEFIDGPSAMKAPLPVTGRVLREQQGQVSIPGPVYLNLDEFLRAIDRMIDSAESTDPDELKAEIKESIKSSVEKVQVRLFE